MNGEIEIDKLFKMYDESKSYVNMDIYKEYKTIVFTKDEAQND